MTEPKKDELWKYKSTVEDDYFVVTISAVHEDMVAYHWVDSHDCLLTKSRFTKEFMEMFRIVF